MVLSQLVIFVLVAQAASVDSDEPSKFAKVNLLQTFRMYKSNQWLADKMPFLCADEPSTELTDGSRRNQVEITLDSGISFKDLATNSMAPSQSNTDNKSESSHGYSNHTEKEEQEDDGNQSIESTDGSRRNQVETTLDPGISFKDLATNSMAPSQSNTVDKSESGHGYSNHAEREEQADGNQNEKHEGRGGYQKEQNLRGFLSPMKRTKKYLPTFTLEMYEPWMFMLGMAHSYLHNFLTHVLIISKLALTSVIVMILREMVFGDKDQPVKYYNFGYDNHYYRRYTSPNNFL